MTTDFRTIVEKERDARHQKVCNMYTVLKEQHPDVKPSRLFSVIGNELGMTSQSVRNVCIAYRLYRAKKRTL